MLAVHCHPTLRSLRSRLPQVLAVAAALAFAACDGSQSPLAPADEALAPTTEAAPSEAVASDNLTLITSQRIAFTSLRNGTSAPDVYKMDPEGLHVLRLTSLGEIDAGTAWSYDNKHIVLPRRRLGPSNGYMRDLYVIDADGSNGHWVRATPFPYALNDPSWSPDGSRIVLSVSLNHTRYLGWMDVATGQVNLFNAVSGGQLGEHPSYDPTGQKIIYVGIAGKTVEQINADGSGHTTRFSSATLLRDPTFSPDGKKIAFARTVGTGNNDEIFVKNLVDGSVKRLTTSAAIDIQPTWSPDGSKIAFARRLAGGAFQIYTMSANGGTPMRITHTSTDESSPSWSH